jgi:hypothetical protein
MNNNPSPTKKHKTIHDDIKNDFRLPIYLLIVGILGLLSFIFNFFPAFQIIESSTGEVQQNVSGWIAHFGGEDFYYFRINIYGVIANILMLLSALASIVFTILLKTRKVEGHRRFVLIVVALGLNISAIILFFSTILSFSNINNLSFFGVRAVYQYGLIMQAIALLTATYIQWFFYIKIRHYIK